MARRVCVAVIGAADCTAAAAALAEAVGRGVARRGAALVTGDLGGVMAAASKGAREAGGLVVGILPAGRAEDANPHVVGLGTWAPDPARLDGPGVIPASGAEEAVEEAFRAIGPRP